MLVRPKHLKKTLIFVLASLFIAGSAGFAADEPEGKALFLDNKCNGCHAVDAQGIEPLRGPDKAPDLSNAGTLIPDKEWAKQFVLREVRKDGKKHKKPYKGSEEELETIIDWLMSLKAS